VVTPIGTSKTEGFGPSPYISNPCLRRDRSSSQLNPYSLISLSLFDESEMLRQHAFCFRAAGVIAVQSRKNGFDSNELYVTQFANGTLTRIFLCWWTTVHLI